MLQKWLYQIYKRWFRKRTTVRAAFPVVFASLVIAGAAVISSVSNTSSEIIISVEPEMIGTNEEFFIHVRADAHTPANTVDIEIAYPEQYIEILGIDTGGSVVSLWTVDPYWKDGVVYLQGGIYRKGFVGEHHIARIRAKGLQRGSALITTDAARLLAGDGKGTEIQVDGGSDAEVYIGVPAPEDGEEGSGLAGTEEGEGGSDSSITARVAIQVITDLDGDGEVGFSDIARFMSAWRSDHEAFDFNGDGRMTFTDFAILLADSFFK